MFRRFIPIALMFPLVLQAQGVSQEKMQECGQKAWLFSTAAQFRDSNMTPQDFMKFVRQNHPNPLVLDDSYIKRSVNAVYFDRAFAGLDSGVLYNAIAEACANPTPRFQPLK